MRKLLFLIGIFVTVCSQIFGQNVILDGYVFEKYNRGFLNEVSIRILDKSETLVAETMTDMDGHFNVEVPAGKVYLMDFNKKVFAPKRDKVSTVSKIAGEKVFIQAEMERQPGYLLEVTLAEKRFAQDVAIDAVHGTRIEIYNNTFKKQELVIDSAKSPVFSFTLQQGNEYTILIRKKGFYNKRLHVNVNINGCYLCMDGFGTVNPGVVSNLTSAEDNKLGTLIANVELDRIDMNRNIVIQNIYYAYNSAAITEPSKKELGKVITLLKINPSLIVELGSHTDSRGSDDYNLKLSQQRAQAAVDYILASNMVDASKLKAKGYGETKLVNKCVNGATCSEDQHLQNRRTELKIIGFTNDAFSGKSLVEIMHDEEMTEFVKSGEGEKEYSSTPISTNKKKENTLPKTPPSSIPSGVLPRPVNKDNTDTRTEKPTTRIDNFEEQNFKNQSTEPFDDETINITAKTSTNTEKIIKVEPFEENIKPQKELPKPVKEVRKENPETVNLKVNLQPVGDYSGYKIEIFIANKPLSADDSDLKMIAAEVSSDIFYDVIKLGETSYLIGYFQGWTETEAFLEKVVTKYPKARIIEYFKGKRLGN